MAQSSCSSFTFVLFFILFYYYYTELSLIIFHLLSMVWALCVAYCLYYFTSDERKRYDYNFHFALCLDGMCMWQLSSFSFECACVCVHVIMDWIRITEMKIKKNHNRFLTNHLFFSALAERLCLCSRVECEIVRSGTFFIFFSFYKYDVTCIPRRRMHNTPKQM